MIVVMDKGYVKWVGSSADLAVSSYSAFSPQNEFDTLSYVQGQELSIDDSIQGRQGLLEEKDSARVSEEAQEIIEVELRKEGRVAISVYK